MHLCLLILNTSPNNNHNLKIGGAEKQLFILLPEYERIIENLTLITMYSTYKPKKQGTNIIQVFGKKEGFIFRIIKHIFRYKLRLIFPLFYSLFISLNIIKTHNKKRIDALNIHMLDFTYLPALFLSKILGFKTIYKLASIQRKGKPLKMTSRNKSIMSMISSSISPKLLELTLKMTDLIQAINKDIKEELVKNFKVPEGRIFLQPNGVNYKDYQNLYDPESKNFGFVGRLAEVKNIQTILMAFKIVQKNCENWKLLIYGEGPEKKKLAKLVKKLGIKY
jgi:glycosyltransferase involved in cell wall biosynthesis